MEETLREWRFVDAMDDVAHQQCQRVARRGKSDKNKRQMCECGAFTKCHEMDTVRSAAARQHEDGKPSATDQFVEYIATSGKFLPVVRLLGDHLRAYMAAFCKESALEYGTDVVVCLKGGNAFSMLTVAFVTAAGHADLDAFVGRNVDVLRLGDIDFDVFLGARAQRHAGDVALLMAMALYDVRWALSKSGVLDGLTYSNGAGVADAPRSDTIVTQIDGRAPRQCPRCNTYITAVPSVLRSKKNKWYRPDGGGGGDATGKTHLPISLNNTLKRSVGADVVLMRIKNFCRNRDAAEIYDVAMALPGDPMHESILAQSAGRALFLKCRAQGGEDVLHISGPYSTYHALRHTFFFEDPAPWEVFKRAKKIKRMAFAMAFVAVHDGGATVRSGIEQCLACAEALADPEKRGGLALVFPFDEFVADTVRAVRTRGDNPAFRSEAALACAHVAVELHECSADRLVGERQVERALGDASDIVRRLSLFSLN